MADLKLGIGQIGITQYLLVNLRKTTDPVPIYDSQSIPPPVSTSVNLVFANIDPVVYYVDFRQSPDGSSLGTLLGTFHVDATKNVSQLEVRFYKVGSGIGNSPDANTDILSDPYLDGKVLVAYKEGLGRPLVPPTETYKEFDYYPGGGIQLLNGLVWSLDEIIAIWIENKIPQTVSSTGRFVDVAEITADLTLNNTHYNKRLRCECAASVVLVVTMDDLNNVPDGAAFKFMGNGGMQNQTRLIAAPGNLFRHGRTNYTEITFSPGESLTIEKRIISSTAYWEVYDADKAIDMVGERFAATWKDHPNCKPEDGALYDGDEWPRIWYWINNKLPGTHKITDALVTGGGYVHPAGKEGLFVVHPTLKKFRLPNTQSLAERGLKDFDSYNADGTRVYDYPGGVQNEQVADHTHTGLNIRSGSHSSASSALSGPIKFLVNNAGDNGATQSDATTGGITGLNGEMRVKNIGVIYLRRF
jgi:hypothetical protein